MIREFLPRCLTHSEIEAIARVERAGKNVDYAALSLAIHRNIAAGVPMNPVFEIIYSPLMDSLDSGDDIITAPGGFDDDDWYQ